MDTARMNELVRKFKAVEQKKIEATVDLDKDILKYEAKLQQLREERNKKTEKLVKRQETIKVEIDELMDEFVKENKDKKTYDAGMGKVSMRVTTSVQVDDIDKAVDYLKDTDFVRVRYELDKTKIRNELSETKMKKAGIYLQESKSVTIK